MGKFGFLQPQIILKLFDSKVAPTYGAEVWCLSGTTELEKVASKFYQGVLGLRPNASNVFVGEELGRHTMASKILTKVVKFWAKLVHFGNERAAKQWYLYQKHLADTERTRWISQVRDLLFAYGRSDAWINQSVGSIDTFVTEFLERSRVASHHEWITCVNTFGSLRTYKSLKSELKLGKVSKGGSKAKRFCERRKDFDVTPGRTAKNRSQWREIVSQ